MPGKSSEELFIAGVGASAGGLESMIHLLRPIKKEENCCIVIVQHMNPDLKSELVSILQRNCAWRVKQISHKAKAEKSTVFVTPPDKEVYLQDDRFMLKEREGNIISPSIDGFFSSLAAKQSKAIGVVLSGRGKDGTQGVQKIKEQGGYVICQVPSSGSFEGMPQSAVDSSHCDIVLRPHDIFKEIQHFIHNHGIVKESRRDKSIRKDSQDIILDLLAERTGTDFSQYKSSTITRRVAKRSQALAKKDADEYLAHIEKEPKELDNLLHTVLIGVTEFYRDPEAYKGLTKYLQTRINKDKRKKNFRVWSVGCATGEESYTLAIMLMEVMEKESVQFDLQIFASDIDERALDIARAGIYGSSQIKNMSKELVDKYFNKVPEGYQTKRRVRQHILFTRQDITEHPPFIHLDLLVCRNLLIYFNSELQRETLKLFHYALNEDALLFLGKSESTGSVDNFFKVLDSRHKIYVKDRSEVHPAPRYGRISRKGRNIPSSEGTRKGTEQNLKDIVKETLIQTYEHPFVVVDEQNKIREIFGSVRLYLEIKNGGADVDVIKMVNPEMQLDLKALLFKARKSKKDIASRVIHFTVLGQDYLVRIRIKPLLYLYGKSACHMVIFEGVDEDVVGAPWKEEEIDTDFAIKRVGMLEEELAISKEHLQAFTEELETANEELQSMNEELQSSNEELKSSNEQLEASNEELQSANEELAAANSELRNSNEALLRKDDELETLNQQLEESEIRFKYLADNAPVMIWMTGPDKTGNYFNKKWKEFTGRSMMELNANERKALIHPDDAQSILRCFDEAYSKREDFTIEYRLKTHDDTYRWVLSRGVPRHSSSGGFLGYVGANSDIDEIKTLEQQKDEFMSIAGHELKTPLTTSLAYLQLIAEHMAQVPSGTVLKSYVQKMLGSMQKMKMLINDLLEMGRIESDRLNYHMEDIAFDDMVYEYATDYGAIVADRNFRIEGKTNSYIRGDRIRLEQVINNVLSNAVKFSEKDSGIAVLLSKGKGTVRLAVNDHGVGIPEEYRDKIFERFFRVPGNEFENGMGVGLFICKQIIQGHGGTIKVENHEEQGTSFAISIPASDHKDHD